MHISIWFTIAWANEQSSRRSLNVWGFCSSPRLTSESWGTGFCFPWQMVTICVQGPGARNGLQPPKITSDTELGIWHSKSSQSPSCWQLWSGRNPVLLTILGGDSPLPPTGTGWQTLAVFHWKQNVAPSGLMSAQRWHPAVLFSSSAKA